MTSDRQFAANRRNALLSTGPRTRLGKQRSRRNALRHELTAETVVAGLDDEKEYRSFERSVLASYAPTTVVGTHLASRLASLLWRLRRATAIEGGLFAIQAAVLRERRQVNPSFARTVQTLLVSAHTAANLESPADVSGSTGALPNATQCFLRVANRNGDAFERISRYQVMLWKQVAQTVILLDRPGL